MTLQEFQEAIGDSDLAALVEAIRDDIDCVEGCETLVDVSANLESARKNARRMIAEIDRLDRLLASHNCITGTTGEQKHGT